MNGQTNRDYNFTYIVICILYFRRSAQFVDVLGYFSVQECREGAEELMSRYSLMAVAMLK